MINLAYNTLLRGKDEVSTLEKGRRKFHHGASLWVASIRRAGGGSLSGVDDDKWD